MKNSSECGVGMLRPRCVSICSAIVLAMLLEMAQGGLSTVLAQNNLDAAFATLDRLARELDEHLQSAEEKSPADLTLGSPDTPAVTKPEPGTPWPAPAPDVEDPQLVKNPGIDGSCPSTVALAEELPKIRDRYDDWADEILEVNGALPEYREAVLDLQPPCQNRLVSNVSNAIVRMTHLDLQKDLDSVTDLGICVDRNREKTDEKFAIETSTLKMQRLSKELERLGILTDQSNGLERALVIAIGKRDRIVQELEEMESVISNECE